MKIGEASIRISRNGDKLHSVSVHVPVRTRLSPGGYLLVFCPSLHIDTIAKDEKDVENAMEEAIINFFMICEKFGQGVEKELLAMGWMEINGATGEPAYGYNDFDVDTILEQILKTGTKYVNNHLEIA